MRTKKDSEFLAAFQNFLTDSIIAYSENEKKAQEPYKNLTKTLQQPYTLSMNLGWWQARQTCTGFAKCLLGKRPNPLNLAQSARAFFIAEKENTILTTMTGDDEICFFDIKKPRYI